MKVHHDGVIATIRSSGVDTCRHASLANLFLFGEIGLLVGLEVGLGPCFASGPLKVECRRNNPRTTDAKVCLRAIGSWSWSWSKSIAEVKVAGAIEWRNLHFLEARVRCTTICLIEAQAQAQAQIGTRQTVHIVGSCVSSDSIPSVSVCERIERA